MTIAAATTLVIAYATPKTQSRSADTSDCIEDGVRNQYAWTVDEFNPRIRTEKAATLATVSPFLLRPIFIHLTDAVQPKLAQIQCRHGV